MTETYDDYVRSLYRLSKPRLADLVERWAREHGQSWVIGGPRQWSKDELISALARIRRSEEL